MALIDDVKLSLRIKNTVYDNEIKDLIDSAKKDLALSGILEAKIVDNDELIKRAIITYCKANFGFDNQDSEKFQKSYDMLKVSMSLAGDYNAV